MVPPPATATVVWLGSAHGGVGVVGGKAASLDRLARLGFRIPPGFCLTTAAFDVQLEAIERAREVLAALPDEAARCRITEAMERAPIEPGLAAELDEAVAQLVGELGGLGIANPLFAVRSSGIGEDGSAASYAGLHETELGVRPEGVADAVRRCWASLWSGPAVAYRQRKSLTLDGGGMAVVVQSLVPADASAVVFTRNPVTHTDDLVITAVRGLGEAMVAGTTTPETIVLDRATREVIDYTPGIATAAWSPARTAGSSTSPMGRTARRSMATSSTSSRASPSTSSAGSVPPSTSRPRSPAASGSSSRLGRSPPAEGSHDRHRPRRPPPRRGRPGISRRVRACGRRGADAGSSMTCTGRSR